MLSVTNLCRYFGKLKEAVKFERYNALLEGTFQDDVTNFHYKLVELEIPAQTHIVVDKDEFYFHTFSRWHDGPDTGVMKYREELMNYFDLDTSLRWMKGKVIDAHIPVLACIRSIFLSDGRVFIREREYKEDWYKESVEEMTPRIWSLLDQYSK